MAAPAKYPTPAEQLRTLAVPARIVGTVFDDFWDAAVRPRKPPFTTKLRREDWPVGVIIWPRDSWDREVWRGAIAATREGWRRAYDRMAPTRPEAALILLGPELSIDPAELSRLVPVPAPTSRETIVEALRGLGAEAALRSAA